MISANTDSRELILRVAVTAGTALLTTLISGPFVIRWLKLSFPERIASDSARLNELHAAKRNTPTMGGVLIVLSIIVAILLTGRRNSSFVLLAMATTVALTLVGACDDWIKLRTERGKIDAQRRSESWVRAASLP